MEEDIWELKDEMSKLAKNGDVVMGKLDNILQEHQKMNSKLDTVLNILHDDAKNGGGSRKRKSPMAKIYGADQMNRR